MFTEYKYLDYGIVIVGIALVGFVLLRILRLILRRFINKSSRELNVAPTHYKFLNNGLSFIILFAITIAIFYVIPELRTIGMTMFAGAGIFAAVLGLASQSAFSNIISGIFIVIFKPFRVGDIVKIGTEYQGIVEDITLRHTVINNFENRRLIIPNSVISSEVILNSNIIEEKVCNFIFIGISYDADVDLAMKIIREEAMAHPHYVDNRDQETKDKGIPPVIVRLIGFGDSSVNLRAQVWSADPVKGFEMKCDLHKSIKEQFDRSGIEIPFPYRTIVFKDKIKE